MYEQIAIQKLLSEKLSEARVRNPAYSLRAFAKQLGVSSSALSEILNGRRPVTRKMALRILSNLSIDVDQAENILFLFPDKNKNQASGVSRVEIEKRKKVLKLRSEEFKVISQWYHYAILSLLETDDCVPDTYWIAGRLGISNREVKSALDRLETLGAISQENGKIKFLGLNLKSTDDIPSMALKSYHASQMDLAKESLQADPIQLRDMTSVTMAVDVEKLPQAKKLIRDFKLKMSQLLETGKKSEVYVFATQLYPISRRPE